VTAFVQSTLGFMLAVLMIGKALAGNDECTFTVSATVPAQASLTVLEEPPSLLLSSSDVARGYKEVAARYRINSNAPAGYLLRLVPRSGVARRIEVGGLADSVTVDDETVEIHQRPEHRSQEITLRLRFLLDASVPPGRYGLPLLVMAAPL
jgi:hypothetical protein